ASGREDVDVRMLGSGRPFYVEAVAARRRALPPDAAAAAERATAAASAGAVTVAGLRSATPAVAARIRAGENEKHKAYAAVVWASRPLDAADLARLCDRLTAAPIMQRTPVRVIHRRTVAVRPRA